MVELIMRDVWDSTPLYYSCLCVCRYLTEHKEVELNMRDVWDSTPLYYACLCGHKELVEYLLNRRVDFQFINEIRGLYFFSLSLMDYFKNCNINSRSSRLLSRLKFFFYLFIFSSNSVHGIQILVDFRSVVKMVKLGV